MTILIKFIAALLGVILVLVGSLWAVGSQQPSRVIYEHEKVIFVAIRQTEASDDEGLTALSENAIWKARALFPLIEDGENYWSDFFILPPDYGSISELKSTMQIDDIYAAEVQLIEVPSIALGMMRMQYLIGLSKRPDGELPESIEEVDGRLDILPSNEAIARSQALASDKQVTMVNFLEYFPADDGNKTQARQAYGRYGQEAFKAVHGVGGQFLFAGRINDVLVEAQNEPMPVVWDDLAAMIYPDPTAIFAMEQNPDYRRSLGDRDEGLRRTRVVASEAY